MKKYFTLVLIAVFLIGVTTTNASPDSNPAISRAYKAKTDMEGIDAGLALFRMDVGRYPSNEEGLQILVKPTEELARSSAYKPGGYIERLPKDPWGGEYQYRNPGVMNPGKVDLWTLGADGKIGGYGFNADFGNWPESFERYYEPMQREERLRWLTNSMLLGALVGFLVGLPVYLAGVVLAMRAGTSLRLAVRGFHLGALLYLTCLAPAIMAFLFVVD